MKSVEHFNKKIDEIWEEFYKNKVQEENEFSDSMKDNNKMVNVPFLAPLKYSDNLTPDNCNLLIVGLNPSFSLKGWNELNKKKISIDDLINMFKYTPYAKSGQVLSWDGNAYNNHPYFDRPRELTQFVYGKEAKLAHIDLICYRKTSQKELKKLYERFPDFFNKQLKLSKEIIEWLQPDIVLIVNAYAGELLKGEQMFNISSEIETELGTYTININSNIVPVFFSGMLSGQRALDKGNYERLKWHIKALKDNKRMNTPQKNR